MLYNQPVSHICFSKIRNFCLYSDKRSLKTFKSIVYKNEIIMHNSKSSQDNLMVFIDILVQVYIQLGAFFWVPNIKEPMHWQTSLDGAGIHIIFILFFP